VDVIAIDWSGAKTGAARKIWVALARGGELALLENGRTREEVAGWLIDRANDDPRFVVGLDFAFSTPAWFLAERGWKTALDLWKAAAADGERWLRECADPFFGKPGTRKSPNSEYFRATERAAGSVAGISAKSVFQIGGAGAVGTGSIRGMPVLLRLHDAGFSIWPFDPPAWPRVAEIYPRILTRAVHKSSHACRESYVAQACATGILARMPAKTRRMVCSSEDAFDAGISALVMAQHAEELGQLTVGDRVEGAIWAPRDPQPPAPRCC
jgi:hypothetical protein